MKKIEKIWRNVSYLGVTVEMNNDMRKKIIIGNQATFTSGIITFLCSFFYLNVPAQFITFVGSGVLCFLFVVFNALHFHNFSRVFFTFSIPGLIAAGGIFTPEYIKVAQITGFIALITIPIVLFGITEKKKMLVGFLWIAACFVIFDSIHQDPTLSLAADEAFEFQRKLQIIISLITMLLFVLIFIYLQNINFDTEKKLNESLQKADQQNEKISEQNKEIESMNKELEKRMLRAQMDPHFLFNSLNSIQHFITINDQESALDYLSKFAKMIRQVLENSVNQNVPIADEIKLLRYYLDLQSIRFAGNFQYYIEIDKEIDIDNNEIPFLILQPYVENAIIHGLEHKRGEKKLSIQIGQWSDFIRCVIEDNGIGREAAAGFKGKRRGNYISRGMLVTSKRIESFNRANTKNMRVHILDLHDKDGEATGTRVEIDISID